MANKVTSRKPKTHKGTKKRVKLTKNGKKGAKILMSRSSKNHLKSKDTPSNRRSKKALVEITGKNRQNVEKALKLT